MMIMIMLTMIIMIIIMMIMIMLIDSLHPVDDAEQLLRIRPGFKNIPAYWFWRVQSADGSSLLTCFLLPTFSAHYIRGGRAINKDIVDMAGVAKKAIDKVEPSYKTNTHIFSK